MKEGLGRPGGALTQDGTGSHTYQYDAEGHLLSVDNGSTASYVYNALGERAERNVGGTYTEYLYDKDGSEVGENNRTSWTETWAAFQGRHLFHFSGGSTYFTHMDSLGTTSIVTDYSTGAVVQDELHYPWGQQWAMLGTMQEERFARLHHRDNETSLDPTLFRVFSSNEGRWMTPDRLRGHVGNPQSLNRYGYVLNNPKRFVDPFGLDCGDSSAPWWKPCNLSGASFSFGPSSVNLQGVATSASNALNSVYQYGKGVLQTIGAAAGAGALAAGWPWDTPVAVVLAAGGAWTTANNTAGAVNDFTSPPQPPEPPSTADWASLAFDYGSALTDLGAGNASAAFMDELNAFTDTMLAAEAQ